MQTFALTVNTKVARPPIVDAVVWPDVRPSQVQFPRLEAANLLNIPMSLPAAFEGDLNIVLVAFKRWQQRDIDSWLPMCAALEKSHLGMLTYELPVIQRIHSLGQRFINSGMRAAIEDYDSLARTIPVYTDKNQFRDHLNLDTEDQIHLLLVDNKSTVVWQGQGAFTSATAKSLIQAIEVRSYSK